MQVPPPDQHDMTHFRGGRPGGGAHASGGQTRRSSSGWNHGGAATGAVEEDVTAGAMLTGGEQTTDEGQVTCCKKNKAEKTFDEADASCSFHENPTAGLLSVDPMTEEALPVLPSTVVTAEHVGSESADELHGLMVDPMLVGA